MNVLMIYLIIAYFLHCILGYGLVNGILYSPLYTWAFIVLLVHGLDYIYKKINNKNIFYIIICILIGSMIVLNYSWINKFGKFLIDDTFKIESNFNYSYYIYLKNGDFEEPFLIINKKIYRLRDGKEIITNIDVFKYSEEENCIVGLLKDSRWFKIYYEDNKLKLNITDDIREIEEEYFYIFGMGLREKFILTSKNEKYVLIRYSDKKEIIKDLVLEKIDYPNYTIYLRDNDNKNIKIYEDETGIYIDKKDKTIILDNSVHINIPDFQNYKHKDQLKILLNEIMVNITEEGPKPNFIAYDGVWYRDAAIMAMALEKTNNLEQIKNWVNNINKVYDEQNGTKEADNLGQVLYLLSFAEDNNKELIEDVLKEAENLRTEDGYINGITDGGNHPVYQTKWLIFGMKKLGIDSSQYKVPNISDSYGNLLWFDKEINYKDFNINDRWQYLYYANIHHNSSSFEYRKTNYPISNEAIPSKANFENMSIINKNFTNARIVTPHAWSAAEMFLYLLDLERENL